MHPEKLFIGIINFYVKFKRLQIKMNKNNWSFSKFEIDSICCIIAGRSHCVNSTSYFTF